MSTFFVNFRFILVHHELTNSKIYAINGIIMTVAFFFWRVIFYFYALFVVLIDYIAYRSEDKNLWS